jgi:hypothetical protein
MSSHARIVMKGPDMDARFLAEKADLRVRAASDALP